jgi:hypothetical protein
MTRDSDSEISPNVVVSTYFCKHEIALTESGAVILSVTESAIRRSKQRNIFGSLRRQYRKSRCESLLHSNHCRARKPRQRVTAGDVQVCKIWPPLLLQSHNFLVSHIYL